MSVAPEDARLTGGGTPEQSPWTSTEVYHPRILDNVKSYLKRGDKEPTLLGIQSAAFRYFKKAVHVMMHSEKGSLVSM
ncbi:hypothetical protein NpNSSI1_00006985 [Neofusicoccum parvum]|uniref:Uncharacterized protein n=1 Tax=Neofusicoccum parvum TaxID=310453 RepID=A0ACB5RSD6_9PEZI|nr:hypothetical protein NpPPO83_00006244 [Neofusicoccum parvum]GME63501.1 hypothetical protein NpNSSI1_00006985 [Neofusicoccum parvum]